jgi:hypothetical protein
MVASVIIIAMTLGFRPDLWLAMQSSEFWMKLVYTLSIAAIAISATARLARPNSSKPKLWLIAASIFLLLCISIAELIAAPRAEWMSMWLGQTASRCPFLVFGLSLPIFAALLLSLRQLAPTQLRAAGAVTGLAAGAFSAAIYCLHCPEVSAIFVLCWYSLGILLATAFGALAGPRFLRW